MSRSSIRKQLLVLFAPFLLGLWITSSVISVLLAANYSRDSFDRDLTNTADSVVGRLRLKGTKIVVDLPPAAQAILRRDEEDRFYYRVLNSDGQIISGDAEMPPPASDLVIDIPKVTTTTIAGKTVRLEEIKTALDEDKSHPVIVQVAETTNARDSFQEKMLLSIALPQLFVVALGLIVVWNGVTKILAPLNFLQEQLRGRSQLDLRPLEDVKTPEEIFPLVNAINHLLERLKEDIRSHQRFVANAAHQLRTPLAVLKTYSSIGSEMNENHDLKNVVFELDRGIDRASRIVSQLLALARTDAAEQADIRVKEHFDLNFLISDAVEELAGRAISKKIQLAFEAAQSDAIIYGEPSGIRHLIVNLLENSILYTPNGGTVIVRVENSGGCRLTVADSGPGIPVEEREKVFERFYRLVDSNGSGSGLGLAIVKEVAIAHNATITIDSGAHDLGTVVKVQFPA